MSETPPGRRLPALRWGLAAVALVLPLVPIVIGLFFLTAGGVGTTRTATAAAQPFHPLSVLSKTPEPNLLLPPGPGTLVAIVQRPTVMRRTPGGQGFARVPVQTAFGSPDAMWVRQLKGPWLGVVSVLAGNNRLGWIPAADASLTRVSWRLDVAISAHRLTVLHDGHIMETYTVAVGAPASPTPTGRFAVTDRLSTGDPSGPYGCCILALSAVAPHVIQGWNGGNRIAIHSTPETWTIGESVSHGCVRLTLAEGRWLLSHIPVGTPTYISS
jgi:hypothetical protein